MKKVVFVEPKSPGYHVYSGTKLPRLGTLILGKTLKNAGYDVHCYFEDIAPLDFEDLLSADLVGISTITSTANRGYALADILKTHRVPTFLGGSHVTFATDEAMAHADYVVRGEADETIVPLVRAILGEPEAPALSQVPGLSWRREGTRVDNPAVRAPEALDDLPVPDFSLIRGFEGLSITPVMTSRGCPYDCSFCSVTEMFGRGFRYRSTESVLAELKDLKRQGIGDFVFFYDDIFNANPKRMKELLKAMIEEGVTPRWTAQVRVEVARDEELLDLMQRSGCYVVYIGMESVNPETLKLYSKRTTLEQIETAVQRLHRHDIRIHGMFVLGADTDTRETFPQTIDFVRKVRLETVQFMILTPMPGTRDYASIDAGGRLLTRDWSLYDGHHVVYEPARMSAFDLQRETQRSLARFYSWGRIARDLVDRNFLNVAFRTYGHRLIRKWQRSNQDFLENLGNLTQAAKDRGVSVREYLAGLSQGAAEAGRAFELKAHRVADDIVESLRRFYEENGWTSRLRELPARV